MERSSQHPVTLDEHKRAWLSLAVVLHFFILSICLVQNNGASFLVKRIGGITSPYSILTHQDYGARRLEMTTGAERSWPHLVQVKADASSDWQTFQPATHWPTDWLDQRWKNFQHMLAVAASENNEELIYLVFQQIVQQLQRDHQPAVSIRLVRPSTLSFAQDSLYRAGRLPAKDLDAAILYEARVISLPGQAIRLLPVLEATRRATSLEPLP